MINQKIEFQDKISSFSILLVTIGTSNLISLILNFADFPSLDKMQSSMQFNSRWILKLINSIFSNLQKILQYFNGTTIFCVVYRTICVINSIFIFPTRAALYLNDWELSIVKTALLTGTSSLLNCRKLPDVSV